MPELVLVIDDSPTVLLLTQRVLESVGYRVETCSNPMLLAAQLRNLSPDLVLLDVEMPCLSGTEALDMLRKYGLGGDTKIALFSSLPPERLELLAREHAATGWIRKDSPLDAERLLERVAELLAGAAAPPPRAEALIVDDSRIVRRILAGIVSEQLGFRTSQAEGGQQALEQLHPGLRLLLVDLHMPGMDGAALVRRVRQDPAYAGLKVVMVSSETDGEQIRALLGDGVDEFILKPFEVEAVASRLRMLGLACGA